MDEQNPRLTAEDMSGRGDDRMTGYDRDQRENPIGPGSEVWRADRLRADGGTETADSSSAARTSEIRAQIAQTREELSETVNAIQDRLRPSTMAAEAADTVKRAALSTAREVGDSEPVMYARANPIPAAMVAIGVAGAAWLAMAGRDGASVRRRRRTNDDWDAQSRADNYRARLQAEGAHTQETASAYDRGVPSTYGGSYGVPRESRSDRWLSHESRFSHRSRTALPDGDTLRDAWDENPLLIGAVAALAGAVVGLSVPETEREHQLMGETRDALVDRVQETVRDTVTQVQDVASDAVSKVKNIAGAESGSTKQSDGSP